MACILIACSPPESAAPNTSEAAAPSASAGEAPPALVVGCMSIAAPECQLVVERLLPLLPGDRGEPFAVEVFLGACPDDGPCERSLTVRDGSITVEYADRNEPLTYFVDGPPADPTFGKVLPAYAGLFEPSSARVVGAGPFPFELAHCGLLWQVDFDGSFWLPIGEADGDAPPMINSDTGQMRLLGPNLAEYRNDDRFVVTLARFPGPKHRWLCD
jgi:hypothetical protein